MIRRIAASVLFIVATIVLSILSVPAALVDRSGHWYCTLATLWSKIFLALFKIKIVVKGSEHIRKGEHYVFAANHASYTDIPSVFAAIPLDIRLVLRHTLTRIPIWGWSLPASPFIIINRSNPSEAKRTLAKAADTIRRGASVLLFPEGTRTSDGALQPFKRGAFRLAYDSGATVLPVYLEGTYQVLNRFEKIPRSNKTIVVHIGLPIHADETIEGDRNKELDLLKRTEEAVRALAVRAR